MGEACPGHSRAMLAPKTLSALSSDKALRIGTKPLVRQTHRKPDANRSTDPLFLLLHLVLASGSGVCRPALLRDLTK